MIRNIVATMALLAFGSIAEPVVAQMAGTQPDPSTVAAAQADTVRVAPPTGEREADRAAILAALEQAEPGGTVLFAPGTYLIGEFIRVSVPRVTLQGHPDGTTLRGCDPAGYPEYEVQLLSCNGLELAAGHQTVRNLTIEHAWHGIHIGCCVDQVMESIRTGEGGPPRTQPGGHLIENNRLRSVGTAMRVIGESPDPIVIRRNVFRNVFHALVINGGTAHMLDNDISSPEPGRVPAGASSGGAIGIFPTPPARECGENVIAGNRIEGHPDGIGLSVGVPGTRCKRNVVRDNTIIVRRVPILKNPFGLRIGSESDSTVVGVPIRVTNMVGVDGALPVPPAWELEGETVIGGHRIEGNRVMGAEGIGIEIRRSSGNRIADNVVTGIERRDPFPGNLVNSADPEAWREANGSGIWVSPGSEHNEIRGNTFEDVAGAAVFLEGDDNRVELRSETDLVRDLGRGNEESAADGAEGSDVAPEGRVAGEADTVHVTPPAGEQEADRASILAALEEVKPGGTVQFAPGTYLIGEIIHVTVPGITVLGHPNGTTLRGCHPDMFPRQGGMEEMFVAVVNCNGLDMAGGHQTVRGLTFEYAWHALVLGGMECIEGRGCVPVLEPVESRSGGYRVENNTFRSTANGIRTLGQWSEPAVIRGNRFINTFHAVVVHGSVVHVVENEISVPEAERVPTGHPGGAMIVSATDLNLLCAGNVIAGNRISGHPDGIAILLRRAGVSCRDNVIRENVVAVERVKVTASWWGLTPTESDSSAVGVPIALINEPKADPEVFGSAEVDEQEGMLEGNLIEGNTIFGAEGIGIELVHASGNRIVNNTITRVARRDPFPGITVNSFDPQKSGWREANGSGIWLSPGSDGNVVAGNAFEDVAAYEVFIWGDRNRVTLLSAADSVRDLGSGNRVSGPAGAREPTPDPLPSGILEAGRLVFHQLLHPVGEETYTLAREGDAYVLHADFSHNDRGQRTERSVALHLGLDLAPRASQLREIAAGDTTETAVEVNGRLATVTDASGSRRVAVPDRSFTTTAFAPHAVQALLVRYWLRHGRPASIPVLPRGNAVVRHVGLDTLEVAGESVALDRYHVDGVRWGGQTLWLDGEERLVAAVSFDFNYQAVREGYEGALAFFSERARRDVLTRAEAASRRIAPLHTGTFALVGGALIDGTGAPPLADATVVVRGGRITGVGPRASVTIPADAEVVDVTGTTLLPGLWDMHAHLAGITDFGPIYLAAGVTTVRDVGNETDWGLALREAFATGRIAGPRLLLAAEIDGRVAEAVGAIQADTPEEARALVRHFHDLGFEQIKLYSRLRPELVPVIAEEAHRLGMTVTGHVPWGMSTIEALQAGMDQINHLRSVAAIGNMIPATIRESRDVAGALTWLADLDLDLETRSLVDTLVRHGTVVDPTLAAFELRSRPANVPLHEIEPGAARMPPVMANTIERWFPGRPADFAELDDALQRKDVELVGILHRAGVPIVAGTDVVIPGHSLHRELELYVEAGMTPVEAIQAATIVPARAMGLDHDVGTVEVGKRADLIVVDGDPLRSILEIRNVRAVIANGRIFDTDALWRSVGFETWDQP